MNAWYILKKKIILPLYSLSKAIFLNEWIVCIMFYLYLHIYINQIMFLNAQLTYVIILRDKTMMIKMYLSQHRKKIYINIYSKMDYRQSNHVKTITSRHHWFFNVCNNLFFYQYTFWDFAESYWFGSIHQYCRSNTSTAIVQSRNFQNYAIIWYTVILHEQYYHWNNTKKIHLPRVQQITKCCKEWFKN